MAKEEKETTDANMTKEEINEYLKSRVFNFYIIILSGGRILI